MSKAGKKIMEKREKHFAQSQISSSLPQSILRPDFPKGVGETQKEESGANTPSLIHSQEDGAQSSEITINGVPIVYVPTLEDDETIVIGTEAMRAAVEKSRDVGFARVFNPAYETKRSTVGDEFMGEEETAVEKSHDVGCTRVFELTPSLTPNLFYEAAMKGDRRAHTIYDELAPAPVNEQVAKVKAARPFVYKVNLEDCVAEEVKPGPLVMEDAIELDSVASKSLRFPSFEGGESEFTREEIIERIREASAKTVFVSPGPENVCDCCGEEELIDKESSDGEEAPDMAQVHKRAAKGSGAEAGRGDEDCGSEESGNSQGDA